MQRYQRTFALKVSLRGSIVYSFTLGESFASRIIGVRTHLKFVQRGGLRSFFEYIFRRRRISIQRLSLSLSLSLQEIMVHSTETETRYPLSAMMRRIDEREREREKEEGHRLFPSLHIRSGSNPPPPSKREKGFLFPPQPVAAFYGEPIMNFFPFLSLSISLFSSPLRLWYIKVDL